MLRVLALSSVLLLGFTAQATAEWHFVPMVGLTMLSSTTIVDPELGTEKRHWNVGGAVSLLSPTFFGVEVLTIWTPGHFERDDLNIVDDSRTISLMANLVLTTPRRWTEYGLRPFVSGGLGLMHITKHDEGLFPVDLNMAGFNIGGGAVGFLSQRTGLRFDIRYHSVLNPSDHGPIAFEDVNLRYVTATVGIVFRR
jgi:hypothetical protein